MGVPLPPALPSRFQLYVAKVRHSEVSGSSAFPRQKKNHPDEISYQSWGPESSIKAWFPGSCTQPSRRDGFFKESGAMGRLMSPPDIRFHRLPPSDINYVLIEHFGQVNSNF
jgi:hypothetical protein